MATKNKKPDEYKKPFEYLPDYPTAGAGRGKVNNYRRLTDPKAEQAEARAAKKQYQDDIDMAMMMDRESLPSFNEQHTGRSALDARIKQADAAAGGPPPDDIVTRKKGGMIKKYAKGGSVSASSRGDGIAQRGKTKGRIC